MVQPIFDRGGLVPDEIVIQLIERHIRTHPGTHGFVFKGFPRTIVQAYILDGLLRKMGSSVSFIANIDVPMLDLIKRLDARGKTDRSMKYDLETATIVKRLEEHEEKCLPVVHYYESHDSVVHIDGTGTTEEVIARLAGRWRGRGARRGRPRPCGNIDQSCRYGVSGPCCGIAPSGQPGGGYAGPAVRCPGGH